MKICMLTKITMEHGLGGMQELISDIGKALVKKGHRVVVITSRKKDSPEYKVTDGIETYFVNASGDAYSRDFWEKIFSKFIELHGKNKFDLVNSHSFAGYYLKKNGIDVPLVTSIYGTSWDEIRTRINLVSNIKNPIKIVKLLIAIVLLIAAYFTYEKSFARKSDALIVASNEQAKLVQKYYSLNENKIFKVFHGIDTLKFTPRAGNHDLLRRYGIQNHRVILFVARIEKDKGLQNLILALPEIIEKIPDLKLLVVGRGSYCPEIKEMVKKHNLNDYIAFSGFIAPDELPEYFNTCDLFVNPTIRQNGYDLTILEAMACEKPVVVSNIGSVPTVIEDGVDGLLVPPGDIKKLAEAVIKVLKNKELASHLGRAARRKVAEKFSVESMVEGTIKVYEEVIRRNKEKLII